VPRERFARLDPDRRDSVLQAARREFATHGFVEASYNRIIAAAGVSKGAMYYYFEDKADLFATVVADAADRALGEAAELPPVASREEFWASLASLLDTAFEVMATDPELAGLFRAVFSAPGFEAGEGPASKLMERSRGMIGEYLEKGREVGAVREDVDAGLLEAAVTGLGMGLDGWFGANYDAMSPDDTARFGEQSLSLVRCLVSPQAPHEVTS
jgi:AcrR family transcriptional regulator